jgi:hypothetical protein
VVHFRPDLVVQFRPDYAFRDVNGKVKHRTLLYIIFLEDMITIDQINIVCKLLNNRYLQNKSY